MIRTGLRRLRAQAGARQGVSASAAMPPGGSRSTRSGSSPDVSGILAGDAGADAASEEAGPAPRRHLTTEEGDTGGIIGSILVQHFRWQRRRYQSLRMRTCGRYDVTGPSSTTV